MPLGHCGVQYNRAGKPTKISEDLFLEVRLQEKMLFCNSNLVGILWSLLNFINFTSLFFFRTGTYGGFHRLKESYLDKVHYSYGGIPSVPSTDSVARRRVVTEQEELFLFGFHG